MQSIAEYSRDVANQARSRFDSLREALRGSDVEHVFDFTVIGDRGVYEVATVSAIQSRGVWYILHPQTGALTGLMTDRRGRVAVRLAKKAA